jgi:rfaE bifunctional protein kinase chain/domain
MQDQIHQVFNDFNTVKATVLGDIMLDAYFFGKVDRISPEAPVPVVSVTSKERRAGGAANVAFNLKNLGAQVSICAVVGNDLEGEFLRTLFEEKRINTDGLVLDYDRQTTVKTRVIGNQQQVLRVDEEDTHPHDISVEDQLIVLLKESLSDCDVLVIEDYNKGLLSERIIQSALSLAKKKNIPVVVDPKKENFLAYKGVALFKPNRKELKEGLNLESNLDNRAEIETAVRSLNKQLQSDRIMLTLSEDGTVIFQDDTFHHFPAHPRKIRDVSGAGDSVISVAALCVALNLAPQMTAELSNLAGGLVCEKVGVIPIDRDQLFTEALELFS